MSRPKIIDCIIYNGEPIVQLRLQLLNDLVDAFVFVEAAYTHSGQRKPELFLHTHAAELEQCPKLQPVIIDSFPEPTPEWLQEHAQTGYMRAGGLNNWYRETYQRDYAAGYIREKFAGEQYIVMVCDADEIPSQETVKQLPSIYDHLTESPVHLQMQMFYYSFQWAKVHPWHSAFVLNDRTLGTIALSTVRTGAPTAVVQNSGWHCSFFSNIAGLLRKLESYAEQQFNTDEVKSRQHLQHCLATGCDLFGRSGEDLVLYDTSQLPVALQEFQKLMVFLQTYS